MSELRLSLVYVQTQNGKLIYKAPDDYDPRNPPVLIVGEEWKFEGGLKAFRIKNIQVNCDANLIPHNQVLPAINAVKKIFELPTWPHPGYFDVKPLDNDEEYLIEPHYQLFLHGNNDHVPGENDVGEILCRF